MRTPGPKRVAILALNPAAMKGVTRRVREEGGVGVTGGVAAAAAAPEVVTAVVPIPAAPIPALAAAAVTSLLKLTTELVRGGRGVDTRRRIVAVRALSGTSCVRRTAPKGGVGVAVREAVMEAVGECVVVDVEVREEERVGGGVGVAAWGGEGVERI